MTLTKKEALAAPPRLGDEVYYWDGGRYYRTTVVEIARGIYRVRLPGGTVVGVRYWRNLARLASEV